MVTFTSSPQGEPAQQPNDLEPANPHYVPNQPYFPGVAGFPNQHLIAAGMDMSKVHALARPASHDYPPEYLACSRFFRSMGREGFETEFDMHFWDYDYRRDAQMILPYLYIGPYTAAHNEAFVRDKGITMLLAIRNPHPAYRAIVNGDKMAQTLGIDSEFVEIGTIEDLTSLLPGIIRGINNHVCRCGRHPSNAKPPARKKVLIFCETGNEKALAVTLGYLMAMLNLDLATAINNVQARRLSVNIDLAQVQMLNAFDTILKAQRDVAVAQHQSATNNPQGKLDSSNGTGARKRSANELNHVELNPNFVAQNPGTGPFGLSADHEDAGRRQPAPFSDRSDLG